MPNGRCWTGVAQSAPSYHLHSPRFIRLIWIFWNHLIRSDPNCLMNFRNKCGSPESSPRLCRFEIILEFPLFTNVQRNAHQKRNWKFQFQNVQNAFRVVFWNGRSEWSLRMVIWATWLGRWKTHARPTDRRHEWRMKQNVSLSETNDLKAVHFQWNSFIEASGCGHRKEAPLVMHHKHANKSILLELAFVAVSSLEAIWTSVKLHQREAALAVRSLTIHCIL